MIPKSRLFLLLSLTSLVMSLLFSPAETSAALKTAAPQPDFAKFDARAKAGEPLDVVFFGGSLTWGAQSSDPQLASYRALMARKLEAAYPGAHFHFWDGAIGGTGSQLGAFRVLRDVLSRKPDLVFLDFTVNDGASKVDPDKLASYESIVRRLVQAHVPVVQVILPVKRDVMPNPPARPLDDKHKEIAAAYHLPVADAVEFVRAQVKSGSTTPEALWSVHPDTTHPGDAGYALYAEAAWIAYERAVRNGVVCTAPEKMLNADTYMTLDRKRLTTLGALPEGWQAGQPSRTGITFDFQPSRWLDDVVIASMAKENGTAPQPLRLRVQATNVLLFGEEGQATGDFEVSVDGGKPKTYTPSKMAKNGNLRRIEIVAQGLDAATVHTVEITPKLQPGQELRIESICVSGAPAKVELDQAQR